jgi:hypothetical protein
MRVQRAPRAADQPQRPPASAGQASVAAAFSADVDLDLTALVARLDRSQLVAEVAVLAVAACRAEGLIDDGAALCAGRPEELLDGTPGALVLVDLGASRVRTAGDWGLGGAVVLTLGAAVPTVVSRPLTDGSGPGLAQRHLATLGGTVPAGRVGADRLVRALDAVARAVERPGR